MKARYHSLTISIKRKADRYFLTFKAIGKLSIEDYQMITPIITSTIRAKQQPKLDILLDITQFNGWTMHAALNDFIMSIKYCDEFKRVAVFGRHTWQRVLTQVGNWFFTADIRYFDNRSGAINWITKQ